MRESTARKRLAWAAAAAALLGGLAGRAAAQDISGPPDSILAFSFDEGGENLVVDRTGNLNDGFVRGARFVKDAPFKAKDNYCLEFDSPEDAVDVTADDSLDQPAEITLSAWIKPDGVDGLRYILWGSDDVYSLALRDGVLRFNIEGVLLDVPFDEVGYWTHVAGTYDGATMRVYRNGTLAASRAAARGTLGPLDFRKLVRVGNDETADLPGFDRDFGGRIDDVRIVERALSEQEIRDDLAQPIGNIRLSPLEFAIDLAFPSISAVTTTIPTDGGDVVVTAQVRFDERGALVIDGTTTIDGVAATVKGKAKLKRGVPAYVLTLKTADPRSVVKIKGDPGAATASVKYKGPKGTAKLSDHPVSISADTENPIARVSVRAGVTPSGKITGTALIESEVAGLTLTGTVKGSLRGDALSLQVSVGPWKVVFNGTRQGDEFVGRLSVVIPPDRSQETEFRIPDFTID